jgi:hypothetical protein
MLSLMSSLFDGWFGFIFWGIAYFRMRGGPQKLGLQGTVEQDAQDKKRWNVHRPLLRSSEDVVNYGLILLGAFILVAGTYVSSWYWKMTALVTRCNRCRFSRSSMTTMLVSSEVPLAALTMVYK